MEPIKNDSSTFDRNNVIKDLCLHDELVTSIKLIKLGFGEFQNLNILNDFYFLPFQLLSSGFERIMKCHICLGYHEKDARYPSTIIKELGHDLLKIKKEICNNFFKTNHISALSKDYEFLTTNKDLEEVLGLLSEFGKYARYYNFDIIASNEKQNKDIKTLWQEFEKKIICSNEAMKIKMLNIEAFDEVYGYSKRSIIIILERFMRAICRQFTLGKLGKKAFQLSSATSYFYELRDDMLGNHDYRKETLPFQQKNLKTRKITLFDWIRRWSNPKSHYLTIKKKNFIGDWPFYHNTVTIECINQYWCTITIAGRIYALNGSAKGKFKLENPHDAGVAIIGKSIGPFIDKALALGKRNNA
jgi:hypothetical protein